MIVTRTELRKQIKALSELQRAELIGLLYNLNETAAKIQQRADSVLLLETFGTIAFQYWVQDEVGLSIEVNQELYRLKRIEETRRINFEREMDERIDHRLAALRKATAPDENFKRELEMIELQNQITAQREANKVHIEEVRKQIKAKLAKCREWLVSLTIDRRKEILLKAVQEGILKEYSGIELSHIQYYNDVLLPLYDQRESL